MSFRLVPKSVTLNDLERRNGRYFALFQRIPVASAGALRKSSRSLSHLLMISCIYYCAFKILHIRLLCADKYFLLTYLLTCLLSGSFTSHQLNWSYCGPCIYRYIRFAQNKQESRIINIRFYIYNVTDRVRLNVVLKIEVHRVAELELEQPITTLKCSNVITIGLSK